MHIFKIKLFKIINQIISGLNYELINFKYKKNSNIIIYIDKHESVTINDCEIVTRQLQYVFNVENINYNLLEVSSPGIDCLLKDISDFSRFIGSNIIVFLNKHIKGCCLYKGILVSLNNKSINLNIKKHNFLINLEYVNIKKAYFCY